jgi:hypothetical protein
MTHDNQWLWTRAFSVIWYYCCPWLPTQHLHSDNCLSCHNCLAGQPLEYAKLKSEAALLLVGGFETTAHTIAWTLLCLACHPEAEQQVARELGELGLLATPGAPRPRSVSWSDLGRMRQLDAGGGERGEGAHHCVVCQRTQHHPHVMSCPAPAP